MGLKFQIIIYITVLSLAFTGCQNSEKSDFLCDKNRGIPKLTIVMDSLAKSITRTQYFQGKLTQHDSSACESEPVPVNIKGRGNTTWAFPKKSYQLKFDQPSKLLSLPSAEKFILLANYSDKSLLRNKLAFKLSDLSELAWTPKSQSVALYLNQDYVGIYLLSQKIEVSENALKGDQTVLLEIDHLERLKAADIYFETEEHLFCIKSKPADSISSFITIKNKITMAENALMLNSTNKNYKHYFDLEALADWYIINEIAKCNDAFFNSSVYLHFKPEGKLKMGPVWDYDISFGNINYNGNDSIEGFYIKNTAYFQQLFRDAEFTQLVKTRYAYFFDQKKAVLASIDNWAANLGQETDKNFERWPILGKYIWPNARVLNSYQEEVDYLKTWLNGRMDWLDGAIGEL